MFYTMKVRLILFVTAFFLWASPAQAFTQTKTINWFNGKSGKNTQQFALPSIGQAEVVCKPGSAYIKIISNKPTRFSSVVFHKNWRGQLIPSVRYNQTDGGETAVGLNQYKGMESDAQGNFLGLVSSEGTSPTRIEMAWTWQHVYRNYGKCFVSIKATTYQNPVSNLTLNWPLEEPVQSIPVPGVGRVEFKCQRKQTLAPLSSDQSFRLIADNPWKVPFMKAVVYQGSGLKAGKGVNRIVDPFAGSSGWTPLPEKGLVQINVFSRSGASFPTRKILVASRYDLNYTNPLRDFCDVSAQSWH